MTLPTTGKMIAVPSHNVSGRPVAPPRASPVRAYEVLG